MAQTPQQRRANEQFAKKQERKMGKTPEAVAAIDARREKPQKSPISPIWLYLLLFVVCGGVLVELLRIIAGFF